MITVSDDDGRVIDLLLDGDARENTSAAGSDGDDKDPQQGLSPELCRRMAHAQDVLGLLALMPVEAPPADLVASTLRVVNFSRSTLSVPAWAPLLGTEAAGGGPIQPNV